MKTCPYCLEDVKDAAIKYPHCQSSLQPETSDRYVRYDIDKGVIGLGKFIVVIATAYCGCTDSGQLRRLG